MTGMQRRLFRFGNRVGVWLYRTSGGRLGGKARGGSPVLILTVKGRQEREAVQLPSRPTSSATAAGWSSDPPAGCRMIRSGSATCGRPRTAGVELRDQHHDVAVRVLEGEERDDAFAQVLRENPSFGAYEGKAGRPMPVAHLTPR